MAHEKYLTKPWGRVVDIPEGDDDRCGTDGRRDPLVHGVHRQVVDGNRFPVEGPGDRDRSGTAGHDEPPLRIAGSDVVGELAVPGSDVFVHS